MNHAALLACGLSVLSVALTPRLAAQDLHARHGARAAVQDPRGGKLATARSQFACVDCFGDRVVATGRDWRATFGSADFEFVPALGRQAPRAMPVRFQLESIRCGEQFLLAPNGATGERSNDRHSVTFARGAIRERYEARPAGLEQTFSIAQRPTGKGDLVVRLAVSTELPAADPGDGTLAWRTPGIGGVVLGKLTAVDASGQRFAGALRRDGSSIELVLPAAAVTAATFPLLLDPLIGSSIEALQNADCDFPDAAYDPYTDSYCVVWTMYLSGSTSAAVGSVFAASDLSNAYVFQINQSGSQDSVRVAHIGGSGMFLLVWSHLANNTIEISGLGLDPGQALATNTFTIAGPGNVDTPAIGGEATPFGDSCVVVWDDASLGVVGCTVTIDVNLGVLLGNLVLVGGGASATEVAISKQGGGPGLYVITWTDRPAGLPGWLRAQVVDYNMTLLGPGAWLQNSTQNAGHAAADGDGFLFLVAWEEQETASPASTDVRGRTITVSTAGITSQGPTQDLAAYPHDIDGAPDVAMLGDKFGVTYQSCALNTPFTDDVFFRAFARNGTPIGGELYVDLTTTAHYVYEHGPRLIGRRDGDYQSPDNDGLLVFADQNTVTIDCNVGLQAVASMGPGGAVNDLGGGCGPGGLATVNGPFALGNTGFEFQLHGAGQLAIPFLSLAFPGPPLSCGVCTLTNPLSFVFGANTAGTATRPLALPGNPALLGMTIEFQWVTFNVTFVGCPQAPGMAASHRVQATIGY